MAKDLTRKQQIFVAEYLKDSNATRAAIAAGYSKHSAEVTGSKLLRNPKVAAEVSKKTDKKLKKIDLSVDKVFEEIGKLAFFDPRKLYNVDGSLKAITELDDDTAAAIAGIDEEKLYERFGNGQAKNTGTVKKVKFVDRGVNLERLLKYKYRIAEKHEHQINNLSELSDDQLATLAARLGLGNPEITPSGS